MEEASGGGAMEEAPWRRHHGGGIWRRHLEEASWMRNHGGDIMEEASGGGIMEEASLREASWRDLAGVWEASGMHIGHLGSIWEASGRLLGAGVAMGGERQVGWKNCLKHFVLYKVTRPTISRRRDERRCHQVPRLHIKVDGCPSQEIRAPYTDPLQNRQDPYRYNMFGELHYTTLHKITLPVSH